MITLSEETNFEMKAPLQDDKKWWRASFGVFSASLTHQEITYRLGLEPTHTHTKGQPRGASRKDGSIEPSMAWRDSAWLLDSPLGRDRNLAEQIDWLLDAIEPKGEAIDSLRPDCSLIRLFCGFASHGGQGGFAIDARTLGRISKLGLNLDVDLYPPSDPEISQDKERAPSKALVQ